MIFHLLYSHINNEIAFVFHITNLFFWFCYLLVDELHLGDVRRVDGGVFPRDGYGDAHVEIDVCILADQVLDLTDVMFVVSLIG